VICNNGEVGIGGFDSMHVKADNNLKALKMTSSNINSYIATFTKLIKMAGYKKNEHGV